MWIGIALFAALIALVISSRSQSAKIGGQKADGTYALQFVWIEDDGTAQELTDDDKDYLNTTFDGGDGARPYIKWRYRSLTPDGKIGGYLRRRQLPKGMFVAHAKEKAPMPKHEGF